MSAHHSCLPAPGPLEAYAVQFDSLLKTPAQRQGFRTYLSGLLLPRDRSKTLTALVGAEPLVQAQAAEVQRLQFFLSEAAWDAEAINVRRLALLRDEPATAPSVHGVLVIDPPCQTSCRSPVIADDPHWSAIHDNKSTFN